MKTDKKGVSTCDKSQESYETFERHGKTYYQYDYRYQDGTLFSCVADSLEKARQKRDEWRASRALNNMLGHLVRK